MNGKGSTTRSNASASDLDTYIQLEEIRTQLLYMGELRLAYKVADRMLDLYDTFDAGEHKELAIMLNNLGT